MTEIAEVKFALEGLPSKAKLKIELQRHYFNQAATARSLGIKYSKIQTMIKHYFPGETLPNHNHYREYVSAVHRQAQYPAWTDIEVTR